MTTSKPGHVCSVVCPDIEFLSNIEIISQVVCPVVNCDKVFSNISAMSLHMDKVHRIKDTERSSSLNELCTTRPKSKSQKLEENCSCKYFCPVASCKFNNKQKSERSLPTFHSLKNHFIRMHGVKKYKCERCLKSFSIKSEMERHEQSCGKLYQCVECSINYATYAALLKHARQKNHSLEGVDKSSRAIESQRCSYKLPLMSNKKCDTSQSTNSQQSSQIVILGDQSVLNSSNGLILLPISSIVNSTMSNPSTSSATCYQNRSFGCQASEQNELISTQEAGSQTVVYTSSIQTQYQQTATSDVYDRYDQFDQYTRNQQRFNQYDLNASQSQETQTVLMDNINHQEQQHSELVPDDYFYSDAATSPLINIEVLLNDMSTQTIAGSQEAQKQSLLADQVGGPYNTRCVTPSNFASCQTDQNEYLFDQLLNASASASTISSYTQTTKYNYSHNVVETQTDWNDFSFK